MFFKNKFALNVIIIYIWILFKTKATYMTITTKRGVEIELIVNSFHNFNSMSTIEVTAVVENGEKAFTLELDNKHGGIDEWNISDFIGDADTTEIEDWADSVEIAFLSSELQKWCILNSEAGKYYSFYMYTFNAVNAVINGLEADRLSLNGKQFYHEQLTGLEQIKEFLNK